MTTSQRSKHPASSPFRTDPEPVIAVFAMGDQVCHDGYGLGRVVNREAHAVTVDFGTQKVRITSPYAKLQVL